MQAVARRMADLQPDLRVVCAYLEFTAPDLAAAAEQLVAGGARHIRVVPLFLGVGRHAREDLPALVEAAREAHADTQFDLNRAVGEDARLVDLLAKIAAENA